MNFGSKCALIIDVSKVRTKLKLISSYLEDIYSLYGQFGFYFSSFFTDRILRSRTCFSYVRRWIPHRNSWKTGGNDTRSLLFCRYSSLHHFVSLYIKTSLFFLNFSEAECSLAWSGDRKYLVRNRKDKKMKELANQPNHLHFINTNLVSQQSFSEQVSGASEMKWSGSWLGSTEWTEWKKIVFVVPFEEFRIVSQKCQRISEILLCWNAWSGSTFSSDNGKWWEILWVGWPVSISSFERTLSQELQQLLWRREADEKKNLKKDRVQEIFSQLLIRMIIGIERTYISKIRFRLSLWFYYHPLIWLFTALGIRICGGGG